MEPSSASNRVFTCPELLELILCFFSAPALLHDIFSVESLRARHADRATLASCARVCRSISELALDVLWCTLDDVLPLLSLFCCLTEVNNAYIFVGDISAEWSRFQCYARRVRSLIYSEHDAIHSSVWMHLAWRCGGQGLLPNVRKLVAENISLTDVAPVTLLLSPSIREIRISFDKNILVAPSLSPVADALFHDVVKTTAPHLTDLFLLERFPLSSSQIPLLARCHNLRHICISDRDQTVLDAGTIHLLERLGPLETMSLAIRLGGCHTAADLDLKTGFPKLSYFNLAGSAVDVAHLLVSARLAALKNLEVTLAGSTDMSALEECIRRMGAQLFQGLWSLHLTVTTMSPQSPTAILGDVISPLYALKGLKSVGLDLGAHVPHTSDNDLIALACAWPKLDWLSIGGGSPPNVRRLATLRRPTIRGLVELAQRCPRLRIINLPTLETSQLPSPESVIALGRARTKRLNLDWISASGGPVRFELAVLLDRLFPELEKFEVMNPGQEEAGRQVFRYLEAMQTGRRHAKLFPQEPETVAPKLEEDSEEEGG